MANYYIICICKDDRKNQYERIQHVGLEGHSQLYTVAQIISTMAMGDVFYVRQNDKQVKIIVATSPYGNKYIKTEADGEDSNNLLSLPQCTGC